MTIRVLNGPNLRRLGTREPHIYGTDTYADVERVCAVAGERHRSTVVVDQTDDEATMLAWLHAAADVADPVVLNAAAWTHTSVAIGDACAMLTAPLIEVHISNIHKREQFRHHSYVSAHASGVIVGCGINGYSLAIAQVAYLLDS